MIIPAGVTAIIMICNHQLLLFASSEKAAEVLAAIKDKGFEATLYDSKGYGEQKDRVRPGRGTSEAQLAYSTRRTIVTIVDSDKLEDVVTR